MLPLEVRERLASLRRIPRSWFAGPLAADAIQSDASGLCSPWIAHLKSIHPSQRIQHDPSNAQLAPGAMSRGPTSFPARLAGNDNLPIAVPGFESNCCRL